MTAALDTVGKKKDRLRSQRSWRQHQSWSGQAEEQGLSLTGPGGLLKQLTKTVLETALRGELTEHLDTSAERRPPHIVIVRHEQRTVPTSA